MVSTCLLRKIPKESVVRLSLPLQLFLIVLFVVCCGSFVPVGVAEVFYTFSSLVREILTFSLPFMVFVFVSTGVLALRTNALTTLVALIVISFLSNMWTSLVSFSVGTAFLSTGSWTIPANLTVTAESSGLVNTLVSWGLQPLVRVEYALISAFFTAFVLLKLSSRARSVVALLHHAKGAIEWALRSLFIPVLPIYVFGFFIKLYYDAPLSSLCQFYGLLYLCAIILQWVMIAFVFFLGSEYSVSRMIASLSRAFPSYLTGLGTMSSIATLPVSSVAAEANGVEKPLVDCGMPILANIHLLGDAVSVPLFALGTMLAFTGSLPSLSLFIVFILYFCLTMLAVSGVPGGGIIVMLPLLHSILGFSHEMLGVMTALYLLHDGFGTAANVMGDVGIIMVIKRAVNYFRTWASRA